MATDKKDLKLLVHFDSVRWGLLPSYRRWGFFRRWVKFIMDPQATTMEDIVGYEVRMYHEFIEEHFFNDGDELTTSPVVKVEKVFCFNDEKGLISKIIDWAMWPKRQKGSLRFTTESGNVITVPFESISKGTVFNMRAARSGARDELVRIP